MKKRLFIAYRFTGEDPSELEKFMERVSRRLRSLGKSHFCSFWKSNHFIKNEYTKKQIMQYCLRELEKSDHVFAIMRSSKKSEGMLLEIGYALARGMKFTLALKRGAKPTYLHRLADRVIEWRDLDHLEQLLESVR